jgi:phage tail sheath protein FI
MQAFNAINKMPNVYIQEVLVPGPIPGVSTSIGAFVGPAKAGPTNVPVRVTNWTQFITTYGVPDIKGNFDPYIYAPPVMLAHAVRGFFDNGGAMCWIVRAGTGARARRVLNDLGGKPALVVTARDEGGNGILATVTHTSLAAGVNVAKAEFTLGAAAAAGQKNVQAPTAPEAAKFFPGDAVQISEAAVTEQAVVATVSGNTITLEANLGNPFTTAAKLRSADLRIGQKRIRLDNVGKIETGTYVKIQGAATDTRVVSSVEPATSTIVLTSGLANAYSLAAAAPTVTTQEFTLKVDNTVYADLSMDPRHSRYALTVVGADLQRVVDVALAEPVPLTPPPNNLPALGAFPLAGGAADDPAALTTAEYIAALATLEQVDDVNILCIPDVVNLSEADQRTLQNGMIAHCEALQDRFAVLDPRPGATPAQVSAYRDSLAGTDRGYAALYYPQLVVAHPAGKGTLTIPPSGHVAGVFARTDDQKGVHKAPANESVRNVLNVERVVADGDHGPLNEKSINVIRPFPGRGIRVWGARTLAVETQWRYVNVRRLMLFIEESIQEGTQFAVFEPNNTELWQRLKRTVNEFLERVWKTGGLLGEKQDEAFRVRIDDELNPAAQIALGILVIEVRVAPTTPAEFVVFQIIQEPGRKIVTE